MERIPIPKELEKGCKGSSTRETFSGTIVPMTRLSHVLTFSCSHVRESNIVNESE